MLCVHFVAFVLILWDLVIISVSPKILEHAMRHYEISVLEGNYQLILSVCCSQCSLTHRSHNN